MKNISLAFFLLLISFSLILHSIDFNALTLFDSKQTLDAIREAITYQKKGAYLSFNLEQISMVAESQNANNNKKIVQEIKEALALNSPTIFKALPFEIFNWSLGYLPHTMKESKSFSSQIYYPLSFYSTALNNPNFCIQFLRFLKRHSSIFIGSEKIPAHIQQLFSNSATAYVSVPSANTYAALDYIELQCKKIIDANSSFKVLITAGISPFNTIVQKRLLKSHDNIFICDLDSLINALCNWPLKGISKIQPFDVKEFIDILSGDIKVMCTTALLNRKPEDYEKRKQEYLRLFKTLAENDYKDLYIVEAIAQSPTFLDISSNNVCYAKVNDSRLNNKGVNEAASILQGFKQFNFNDNDMIIKLTGRYFLKNNSFLRFVEEHPTADAIVCISDDHSVFTGCFAMRYKYFKEMFEQLDLKKMESNMLCIEWLVFDFLKNKSQEKFKTMCVNCINMLANINYPQPNYTLMYF